jgi:hypothetical protein
MIDLFVLDQIGIVVIVLPYVDHKISLSIGFCYLTIYHYTIAIEVYVCDKFPKGDKSIPGRHISV